MIIIVIGFYFVNPNRKAICENHSFSHFVKFQKAFLLKTFQMILRNNNQPVEKASQSLRPQAQIKFKAFLPAACTSAKYFSARKRASEASALQRAAAFSSESPTKWVSFESVSKILF